ncbi:MAG: hypothetical protein M1482_07275 [Chloroflexi bacterium]|nr:hypothetical protein [Chloroflexota bacterium]
MTIRSAQAPFAKKTHDWLRKLNVAFVPGPDASALKDVVDGVLQSFRIMGHRVDDRPNEETELILTTARFGEAVGWRQAPLFSARRRFNLRRTPTIYSLVKIHPTEFHHLLARFEEILKKAPPDRADYDFPGLSPQAYRVLFEQGRRGGPLLALERLVQAQAKSIHVLLVVADERPEAAYHFDLVGAYPKSETRDIEAFYADIVLRIVTTLSTHEVTQHQVVGDAIPRATWKSLDAPKAMCVAARELGQLNFFTDMVRISDLAHVPVVNDAVASQYSEGCFATWDPILAGLVATVTGSARPVDKGSITEDDLAVLVGVREGGLGVLVRHVEGQPNDSPSSESVEMMQVDNQLPRIELDRSWNNLTSVPVIRSKLHGHRGVAAFDPSRVEFVPLDPPYYHYLVSCATAAQAQGITAAFARSVALQNPNDPRQIVFTVLPGHGAVIAEKWVSGMRPFQVVWESMEAGILQVASRIPQGPMSYVPAADGRMVLQEQDEQ